MPDEMEKLPVPLHANIELRTVDNATDRFDSVRSGVQLLEFGFCRLRIPVRRLK